MAAPIGHERAEVTVCTRLHTYCAARLQTPYGAASASPLTVGRELGPRGRRPRAEGARPRGDLARRVAGERRLILRGIAMHIGSQITDAPPFHRGVGAAPRRFGVWASG